MTAASILRTGPLLVGGVLLLSVFLKVVGNRRFAGHLQRLCIPPRAIYAVMQAFVGLESALGAALVVGLWRGVIWPAAGFQIVVLSAITLDAFSKGRITDCGCYEGLLTLTPKQSALVNAVYVSILMLSWAALPPSLKIAPWVSHETWLWKVITVVVVSAGSWLLLIHAVRKEMSTGRPLLDLSALRVGRRWKRSWLSAALADLDRGERLVVFMSTSCPICRDWIKVLNHVHKRADLPTVIGALHATPEEIANFALAEKVQFPLSVAEPSAAWRTLPGVPTAVHLVDGVIRERTTGYLSPEFIRRIRPDFVAAAAVTTSPAPAPSVPSPEPG